MRVSNRRLADDKPAPFMRMPDFSHAPSYPFEYSRIMEMKNAIESFAALAHRQRLAVFRMLVRVGPNGLSAGDIALRLETPPSSLSFHLTQLGRAGLIRSRRESRHVIYAADIEGTRRLLSYLTEDCCEGRPELCGDLAGAFGAARPSSS